MNSDIRPIRLLGEVAIESVRQRAQAALDAWSREWVASSAPASPLRVQAEIENAHLPEPEYEVLRRGLGSLWVRCGSADRANFGVAVVGMELMPGAMPADDWIEEVVAHAWEARNEALWTALFGPTSGLNAVGATAEARCALTPSQLPVGAGAVYLSCEALGVHAIAQGFELHTGSSTGSDAAHCLPPVTPLDRALRRSKVQLDVLLGSVDVELPKLIELRLGDILRLPHRLDERIVIRCDGKPLARAALGEMQGRKGVQILPANHS